MLPELTKALGWLFGPKMRRPGHLWTRWPWFRALGLIFFSAFYYWFFQLKLPYGRSRIRVKKIPFAPLSLLIA
jgi:hypothetical protein